MNTSRSVSRVQGIWLITLAAIILLGLHLRLETAQYTKVHHPIRADAANYTAYAYNLDRHGVYSRDISTAFSDATVPTPDAYRNPGYPLYLSFLISKKLEIFIKRTVYSQALISTLTLILIALLAHAVVGKLASVVVVLLAAISPHLILANTYILTETIYIFFLCLTLLATAKAMITEKQTFWAIAAVLLAATTLIRPTTQYFIVILVLFAWFSSDKRNRTKFSVIVFILFTLIMSTWVIRNFQAIGQPSDPSLMIKVLQHGMYPNFTYNNLTESFGFPYRYDPQTAEITTSLPSVLTAILDRFINEPIKDLTWYLSKPAYFFQWELIQGTGIFTYPTTASTYYVEDSIYARSSTFMAFIHPSLIILSIIGMFISCLSVKYTLLTKDQRSAACILSALYIYFILIHIIAAPFPRYSVPVRPLTYILSILAIYSIYLNIQSQVSIKWKK